MIKEELDLKIYGKEREDLIRQVYPEKPNREFLKMLALNTVNSG